MPYNGYRGGKYKGGGGGGHGKRQAYPRKKRKGEDYKNKGPASKKLKHTGTGSDVFHPAALGNPYVDRTTFDPMIQHPSNLKPASLKVLGKESATENEDAKEITKTTTTTRSKYPKRKVVLLLMYKGTDYSGLQVNKGYKTIEGDLHEAIYRAGGISPENHDGGFHKVGWGRSCRTDKGVHAAGNVITIKIIETPNILEQMNAELPAQIRVIDYFRVTNSFDAKRACTSRSYEYVLPTFAFHPNPPEPTADIPAAFRTFRLTPDTRAVLDQILGTFVGTFNHHNFTARRPPGDKSNFRYIKSFTVHSTFLINDIEFIRFRVHGQSFMLHQIRKMIGATVAVFRGVFSLEQLNTFLTTQDRVRIPKAPGLGLFLVQPFFDAYDQQWCSSKKSDRKTGFQETFSKHENKIEEFIHKEIYPEIAEIERTELSCWKWLWLLMDPEFWGQPQSDNIDLDKPGPSNNSNEMTAHILRRPLWWQDDSPDSKSSSSDSTTLSVQAPTTSSSSSSSNASSFTGVADALVDVGSSSTEPAMTEGKAADVDMN